jgi:hypothetical protein
MCGVLVYTDHTIIMGRIVKRVPVQFRWPLHRVWKGYINPYTSPAGNGKAAKKWTYFDPPKGEGYQLWETTTEGAPISPVFTSFDELCGWAENNATVFGDYTASKAAWKQMLAGSWVNRRDCNELFAA